MEATRFCLFFILAFAEITLNNAAQWTYTGDTGISYWHELFPKECAGKSQSPIDIRPEETTYNPHLKDFAIWYDPPKPDSKMYIHNNGHTVQVDLEGDFFVTNGGLSHVYKALQFHFHWGHKEHHGSEHLIDGVASPIEMHLVTYNKDQFPQISQAVVSPGGLAVLGTMYEISDEDNPSLDTIVRTLKFIRDPEVHEKVELPLMSLRDFLPKDISRYYRYNGSLTTPGCFESVIWTVFDEKQTISLAQLREFTLLLQHKHYHKKGKEHSTRHRRSLNKAERKMENNAKEALVELGIMGETFQEAELKSELMYRKMMGDQPADNTVVEKTSLEDDEEDDDTKKVDRDDDGATENKDEKDDHHHPKHHKVMETEESEFRQEQLVNNFRPAQPLNDRVVYRNFKLRSPVKTQGDDKYEVFKSAQSSERENGATYQKISLTAIVAMLLYTFIIV